MAEEPGRLQSMGSLRVRHDRATSLSLFTFMHWRKKWQPTPVFLPGESQGRGSLVGCCLWGCTESDTTEGTQQQQQQHGNLSDLIKTVKIYFLIVQCLLQFFFPGKQLFMVWFSNDSPYQTTLSQSLQLKGIGWRFKYQKLNVSTSKCHTSL